MKNSNFEGIMGLLLGAGFLGTFGTAIALGVTVKSFWLVLLLLMAEGYIITSMSQVQVAKRETNMGALIFYFILGMGSLVGALFVAKFKGGWLWTTGLITIGLMIFIMSIWMFRDRSTGLGLLLLVAGAGLMILSVAGPIRVFDRVQANLYGVPGPRAEVTEVAQATDMPQATMTKAPTQAPTQEPTEEPTEQPTEEPTEVVEESVISDVQEPEATELTVEKDQVQGDATLPGDDGAVISSLWGFMYLIIIFLIGMFSFRWWGGLLFVFGAFALIILLNQANPQQVVGITRIFSANPIQIWQMIMMNNMLNLRIHLPVLLMGLALVIMGSPLQMNLYLYSQILKDRSKGDAFYRKASKNWDNFGNLLFAILLLTAVITLSIFHFKWGIFFPGFRDILSPYFYISSAIFIILAIWLRAAENSYDEGLLHFISEKTSPTGLVFACVGIALMVPFGVRMLLIGITLGLCLIYTAFGKMEASV